MAVLITQSLLYRLVMISLGTFVLFQAPSQAEPVADTTLPNDSSRVTPVPDSSSSFVIEGGTRRGPTLFHSFQDFSIRRREDVYFFQPPGIDTIISRVTGSRSSKIRGTLGVGTSLEPGNADLFFMNPNGIVFGPNARLDIAGSFIATTASSVLFGDNQEFQANSGEDVPLLLINTPTGLQFGSNPGKIKNQSQSFLPGGSNTPVGLVGRSGETLAFIGGPIELTPRSTISSTNGHLEVGSVGAGGRVELTPISTGWGFDYRAVQRFQTVAAEQATIRLSLVVDGTPEPSSTAQVYGRNLVFDQLSIGAENTTGNGGDLTLVATDTLRLENFSAISQDTEGTGDANSITLRAPQVRILQSRISSSSSGYGNGGNIRVEADSILIEGIAARASGTPSQLFTNSNFRGDAGSIDINADTLILRNGAQLNSVLSAEPDAGETLTNAAGNINVNASLIFLDDGAEITAATTVRKGNINLNADLLLLNDNSAIIASGTGDASGGNIIINTNLITALDDSTVATRANQGDGGLIRITTNGLIFSPDSNLNVSSVSGTDGTIELLIPDSDPIENTTEEPEQPVDISRLVSTGTCTARRAGSSFYMVGKGGIRESPLGPLPPNLMWEDWETVAAMMHLFDGLDSLQEGVIQSNLDRNSTSLESDQMGDFRTDNTLAEPVLISHSQASPPRQTPIETRGWIQQEDGTIVLLSQPVTSTAQGTLLHPHDCQRLHEGLARS